MNTEELIAVAEGLVKELQGRMNSGRIGLQDAEAKILEMVNWIGARAARKVSQNAGRFLTHPGSAEECNGGGGKWGGGPGEGQGHLTLQSLKRRKGVAR